MNRQNETHTFFWGGGGCVEYNQEQKSLDQLSISFLPALRDRVTDEPRTSRREGMKQKIKKDWNRDEEQKAGDRKEEGRKREAQKVSMEDKREGNQLESEARLEGERQRKKMMMMRKRRRTE